MTYGDEAWSIRKDEQNKLDFWKTIILKYVRSDQVRWIEE